MGDRLPDFYRPVVVPPHRDRLLTEDAAAGLLGVVPSRLTGWREKNIGPPWVMLPPAPKPSNVRYRLSDLHAWMNDHVVVPDRLGWHPTAGMSEFDLAMRLCGLTTEKEIRGFVGGGKRLIAFMTGTEQPPPEICAIIRNRILQRFPHLLETELPAMCQQARIIKQSIETWRQREKRLAKEQLTIQQAYRKMYKKRRY